MKKGLLMVFTGNGKSKTTAAIGQAFRAVGHGFNVCFIQFIKGSWKYGELTAAERYKDLLEWHVLGRGFTWKSDNLEKDIEIAQKAWSFAKEAISSGKFQMVVLDEMTYLVTYKMVDESEVVQFLKSRPEQVHVVITGRDASQALIDTADLVTEMKEVKHPFNQGVKAQRGIEF
jgi:cob(I)alamin adenosyltransferase